MYLGRSTFSINVVRQEDNRGRNTDTGQLPLRAASEGEVMRSAQAPREHKEGFGEDSRTWGRVLGRTWEGFGEQVGPHSR